MRTKTPTHYVNNKDLYKALVIHKNEKQQSETELRVPEYVGECILLITNKLSDRPNFNKYSYKDEMIADAIENCLMAVNNFNVEKYFNPHAYFTMIAWNAFVRRIEKEKRQVYLKYKNYKKQLSSEELSNSNYGYNPAALASDDIIDDFIKNYEEAIQRKKKKREQSERGVEKFMKD